MQHRGCQPGRRAIQAKEVHVIVSGGQLEISEIKIGIVGDRLLEQLNGFAQAIFDLAIKSDRNDECLRSNIQTVGDEILGRPLRNRRFFLRRNRGLKL